MMSRFQFTPLQQAEISECENTLLSTAYDDIYFNRQRGLDESLYTYVHANNLTQRWQSQQGNDAFILGELGFGTGLNFFATLLEWITFGKKSEPGFWLHYYSFEKHPIDPEMIKSWAQRVLPDSYTLIEPYVEQLVSTYPPIQTGFYSIEFPQLQVKLVLVFGDALAQMQQLYSNASRFQAWYLDGFDPKKNAAMWKPDLFNTIYRLTATQGSFSTFTAASQIRKDLIAAGFRVGKKKGFGQKREMLIGEKMDIGEKTNPGDAKKANRENHQSTTPPWFACPAAISKEKTALIIGTGIAGCALAHKLAFRGWKVTLVGQDAHIASRASGNPSALVYPSISLDINRATQLYLHCFHFE